MQNEFPDQFNINIEDYNYYLPPDRIAQYPLENRDASKLLFCDISKGNIEHYTFKDFPKLVPDNSFIIRNITKVFPARFFLNKPTGGRVEVLLEHPADIKAVPQMLLLQESPQIWTCTVRGKNINPGLTLKLENSNLGINLVGKIIDVDKGKRKIQFDWQPQSLSFADVLEKIGQIPLPPYIQHKPTELDKNRYQTVFSQVVGSVAAPTAGFHFTPEIIENLKLKGVQFGEITLHIGSGTFVPMKSDNVSEHEMHYEQIVVSRFFIQELINFIENKSGVIIHTGTTTVRTLETIYWFGVKAYLHKLADFNLKQWEWISLQNEADITFLQSLHSLLNYLESNNLEQIIGDTQLFIIPGYKYRTCDGLITNFHLPKSTLLLLVAAFTGKDLYNKIYNEAIENNYRFLSYGDSSFLLKSSQDAR
jgi:S-adenosylmethionine:tRNA ribosyltransferase-isomerase